MSNLAVVVPVRGNRLDKSAFGIWGSSAEAVTILQNLSSPVLVCRESELDSHSPLDEFRNTVIIPLFVRAERCL